MTWLTNLLLGGLVEKFTAPLLAAYQAKLAAETDRDRLAADETIKRLEATRDIAIAETADRWSATRVGRWLIVVPFGLWWAAIYLVQIVNPWFGLNLVVVDVPNHINEMALILIPAIVIGDAGALLARRIRR
ncbi:hypothetical protein [Rhizobium sp. RM]|uniref:hypothetical protein n=1 Tax=Rhizobium sp. RM TaxID=2748079 RepID=UPI00110E9C88|nr:hypothetical protein [Rhizobium sp. RM]NWJ26160.1 hypothetical protein [Rhizobium sp. RM]TMV20752.1 hypothetical protein BJG94_08645 [Rhizobium sp. Td3]